jgi:hypothetical protein
MLTKRISRMMEEMNAKMDTNQANWTANKKKCWSECKEALHLARQKDSQSELKETIKNEMKAIIQTKWVELDETTAYDRATEIELNPGMMLSIEEHQEIPKGEAAVMSVGELRKRHRVQNLA